MDRAVVPAVVYVATAMAGPGIVQHHGRGDLVIGAITGAGASAAAPADVPLQALVDFFATGGVPVRISADVMAELWSKLMVNCAYNAISRPRSSRAMASWCERPEVRELQQAVVREVVAVAAAEGVDLPLAPALAAMERIAGAMPAQLSSTAQDMARRKPSEIDHLNGFVVRRGRRARRGDAREPGAPCPGAADPKPVMSAPEVARRRARRRASRSPRRSPQALRKHGLADAGERLPARR